MRIVNLDFISDFICPWCFIGVSRLDRIKKDLSDKIHLDINILPYFLYPDIPKGGSDKSVFVKKTKTGMGRALKAEAEKENISIDYKLIDKIPNTYEAHRLTQIILNKEQKWQLSKALFTAYFTEGQDIGNRDILVNIARQTGFDNKWIQKFIDHEMGRQLVEDQVELNRNNFIRVVPTVNFNKKLIMAGLQEENVWRKFIRKSASLSS